MCNIINIFTYNKSCSIAISSYSIFIPDVTTTQLSLLVTQLVNPLLPNGNISSRSAKIFISI